MRYSPLAFLVTCVMFAPAPGFTHPRSPSSHSGHIRVSGSRGQTRSVTYSGSSHRSTTPGQGVQQTYTGQITGEGGRTVGVDRSSTTTSSDPGWQRQSSYHVSGPQGTPLYHSDCVSQGQRGSASRTCQTTVREKIYNTSSTLTSTSPTTVDRQTTLSHDGQELGGSQTTATLSRSKGSFTKGVSGQTTGGTPINRTITVTPNP